MAAEPFIADQNVKSELVKCSFKGLRKAFLLPGGWMFPDDAAGNH